MIFVLICTYLGTWGCAYFAAQSWPGRRGFAALYALAIGVVPYGCGTLLRLMFEAANPAYAETITPLAIQVSMLLALVAYPIKYLRAKNEE